jgi:hypothetical protein
MPEAAEILTEALGRPIAFAQTPIEQVRQYSKDMAVMLEWFEHVGYSADIAGLEREFGRALTKLPDWASHHARLDDVLNSEESARVALRVASREHEIRGRAYELYLARGAQPGHDVEDWLQAERELTAGPRKAD